MPTKTKPTRRLRELVQEGRIIRMLGLTMCWARY